MFCCVNKIDCLANAFMMIALQMHLWWLLSWMLFSYQISAILGTFQYFHFISLLKHLLKKIKMNICTCSTWSHGYRRQTGWYQSSGFVLEVHTLQVFHYYYYYCYIHFSYIADPFLLRLTHFSNSRTISPIADPFLIYQTSFSYSRTVSPIADPFFSYSKPISPIANLFLL